MLPPDSLLTWSTVYLAFGPSSASVEAKLDCIWMRTFLSWAAADPAPSAIAAAIVIPPNLPIKRMLFPPVDPSHGERQSTSLGLVLRSLIRRPLIDLPVAAPIPDATILSGGEIAGRRPECQTTIKRDGRRAAPCLKTRQSFPPPTP